MLRRLLDQWLNGSALTLAERAEATARQLSKLPTPPSKPHDLVKLLESTCVLLDGLVASYAGILAPQSPTEQPPNHSGPTLIPDKPTPVPGSSEPSATAWKLMRLCDLLWLAQSSGTALQAQAVAELFEELGKVLACEGVTTLNDTGQLDPRRQRVADTQPTDDPQEHNHIYQTVRPGYQFRDRILRPQEVVISTLVK